MVKLFLCSFIVAAAITTLMVIVKYLFKNDDE